MCSCMNICTVKKLNKICLNQVALLTGQCFEKNKVHACANSKGSDQPAYLRSDQNQ